MQRSCSVTIQNYTLPAATGGAGTLAYSLAGQLPAGLSFDEDTRAIRGTLGSDQQNAVTHTYKVTDENSNTDTINFTIEVRPTLVAPRITDITLLETGGLNMTFNWTAESNCHISGPAAGYVVYYKKPSEQQYNTDGFYKDYGATGSITATITITSSDISFDAEEYEFSIRLYSGSINTEPHCEQYSENSAPASRATIRD